MRFRIAIFVRYGVGVLITALVERRTILGAPEQHIDLRQGQDYGWHEIGASSITLRFGSGMITEEVKRTM
ncbi:MAG: hypothetical protein JO212_09590 [Acetobacteraceae bacterium]|nr:hypothetical protein [Acetobacteraceae bacterium]